MPAGRRRSDERRRGQALVEFALVIPLFLILTLAVVEFAFIFNAVLSTNFATRTAALLAAEGGNDAGTDCVILARLELEFGPPADRTRIVSVGIYRSDANGLQIGGAVTRYARTGSTTCTDSDGSTINVPYVRVGPDGYPETDRCNVLAGCPTGPSGSHPGLDTVGVRITYSHLWRTPLHAFLQGSGSGYLFERSNAMQLEPVL
jgi:hypothetical protein